MNQPAGTSANGRVATPLPSPQHPSTPLSDSAAVRFAVTFGAKKPGNHSARESSSGFSVVELIIVVAVIMVMSAFAVPDMLAWQKTYKIRQAASDVRTEIMAARVRAVTLNVNYGVVFLVLDGPKVNQYQYVVEDTLPLTTIATTSWPLTSTLMTKSVQLGPVRTLPDGVRFSENCAQLNGGTFTGTNNGFRFDRLGLWCNPLSFDTSCPALDTATLTNTVINSTAFGSNICLEDTRTGLKRMVAVSTGGRAEVLQ